MNSRVQIRMLADGHRLHIQDGPIDLIVRAFGESAQIENAYRAATDRFASVLDELCEELTTLRQPWRHDLAVHGAIARRMVQAIAPHGRNGFITPMAAVAGAGMGAAAADVGRGAVSAARATSAARKTGEAISRMAPIAGTGGGALDRAAKRLKAAQKVGELQQERHLANRRGDFAEVQSLGKKLAEAHRDYRDLGGQA